MIMLFFTCICILFYQQLTAVFPKVKFDSIIKLIFYLGGAIQLGYQ